MNLEETGSVSRHVVGPLCLFWVEQLTAQCSQTSPELLLSVSRPTRAATYEDGPRMDQNVRRSPRIVVILISKLSHASLPSFDTEMKQLGTGGPVVVLQISLPAL